MQAAACSHLRGIFNRLMLSSKLVKNAMLKVIPGAPHGMRTTLKDQVNDLLFSFIKA
jgi:non-heme chloroperoxidase